MNSAANHLKGDGIMAKVATYSARDFLKDLQAACIDDKRFDALESVDDAGADSLRVYPFDGPALIITVRREA